jgi:catechol 2,3-dioxygenase-like lactoylglutathione lyase family enzyme
MWGAPPFYISDGCAIDVRNLAAATEWYKKKLERKDAKTDREDDSGRPFIDLRLTHSEIFLSLVEVMPGTSPNSGHVIFFTNHLEKAHQWLEGRGVSVEPITADSGGNRLFRFLDLDGNKIEVCVEPG